MRKASSPPIRDIVVKDGRFLNGFGTWLSDLSSLVARADSSNNVSSPNATDLASAITLANELKSELNDLKNKLRSAGIIES